MAKVSILSFNKSLVSGTVLKLHYCRSAVIPSPQILFSLYVSTSAIYAEIK
jgi:hypothetical protein